MILELKSKGTTVFITTHYIQEAQRICDRLAFIVGGRIVVTDTVSNLMENAASGHSIQFITDRPADSLTTGLQARFAGSCVEVKGSALILRSAEQLPLLPVMKYFDDNGIAVFEAKELRPTLENVFVELTGIEAGKLGKEKEKGGGK